MLAVCHLVSITKVRWDGVKANLVGNSLVVQWLGLHAFTAEGLGSIPGQVTKIPPAE